jgi:ArsR family transcriptional regulator
MIKQSPGTLKSRLSRHPYFSFSDDRIQELATFFQLLSDQTRLRILALLQENDELCVGGLCERLGQSQPTVSHHLSLLCSASLVDRRRDGKHNFYRLKPQRFRDLLQAADRTACTLG